MAPPGEACASSWAGAVRPAQHRRLLRSALDHGDGRQSVDQQAGGLAEREAPADQEEPIGRATAGDALDGMAIHLIRRNGRQAGIAAQ